MRRCRAHLYADTANDLRGDGHGTAVPLRQQRALLDGFSQSEKDADVDPRWPFLRHRNCGRLARLIAAASLAGAISFDGIAARPTRGPMAARQARMAASRPEWPPHRTSLESLARESLAQLDGEIAGTGTREPVEVIRDRWGVPHLYARSADDLFFAQGYVVAQDRLWQMEWWRREREGRMAEVLGAAAVDRDRSCAAAQVPRSDRRPRVDQLSPRRQAHHDGICQRHQCVHRDSTPTIFRWSSS